MKELEILQEVATKLIGLKNETNNMLLKMFSEFLINLIATARLKENADDIIVSISDGFVEIDHAIARARNDLAKHFIRIAAKHIKSEDNVDTMTLVLLNNAFPNDKPKLLEIANALYTNNDANELTEKINELVVLTLWKLIQI